MREDIKSMTLPELQGAMVSLGQPAFRAGQIYTWLHRGARSFQEMTNLSKDLRRQLEEREQEELRRALEAREEERLRRVLDQLRSWGTDCAGVGSQVSRADPARWEKLGSQWTRLFSTVPVEISVEVSLGDR